MRETIKDLDFIIATNQPEQVRGHLLELPNIKEVIGAGDTKVSLYLGMIMIFQLISVWLNQKNLQQPCTILLDQRTIMSGCDSWRRNAVKKSVSMVWKMSRQGKFSLSLRKKNFSSISTCLLFLRKLERMEKK